MYFQKTINFPYVMKAALEYFTKKGNHFFICFIF